MIAWLLFKKIVSLFLIMGAGFALVKLKVLKSEDSRVLSRLTLYLIVPVVIINGFMIDYTDELLSGLLISALAALAILIMNAVLGRLLRNPLKLDPVEECSVVYSNAGNLIIPIVTSVLGSNWVIFTYPFICLQPLFVFSHGYKVLCRGQKVRIKDILTNVNIISIFIGACLFALKVKPPAIIGEAMDSVSATLGPIAMLITGMLLGGMDLKKMVLNKRIYLIAALRLLIFPVLPLLILKFSGVQALHADGEKIFMITLLAAAAPTASMTTQMAQIYDQDAEHASAINVMTTLLCVLTMPIFVMLYQL